jgi:hypothetical protein
MGENLTNLENRVWSPGHQKSFQFHDDGRRLFWSIGQTIFQAGWPNEFVKKSPKIAQHIFCQNRRKTLTVEISRRPFLTSPLGTRDEICPLGGMYTPSFTPRGDHTWLFRRMEGQTENFTPRDNFTPREKIHPWGTTSPLGSKFAPWGDV